jgi:hypothetical protein
MSYKKLETRKLCYWKGIPFYEKITGVTAE